MDFNESVYDEVVLDEPIFSAVQICLSAEEVERDENGIPMDNPVEFAVLPGDDDNFVTFSIVDDSTTMDFEFPIDLIPSLCAALLAYYTEE